jgi:hypothetical protein
MKSSGAGCRRPKNEWPKVPAIGKIETARYNRDRANETASFIEHFMQARIRR